MDEKQLQAKVTELAETLAVPGVAVGAYRSGDEQYAYHGVTSVENPLPVDENTLFQFGSTGKTFTATAIMRLVAEGKVNLDEPVRTYVPELELNDESAAREVRVLHLLNHTAGWAGDMFKGTGEGDDALARYVALMRNLRQERPVGTSVSYNNAAFNLAGRLIEKVTRRTFDEAMNELLLEPLGLKNTFYSTKDIMTRRFAVGHTLHPDGTITVVRPGWESRSASPSGGNVCASAPDQIRWARFHLGDGRAEDGTRILPEGLLSRMQEPTVAIPGSALGDHVGISWMLKDVDGVRVVSHGGDVLGQHSSFEMVPEKDFAIAVLTNCGPNGSKFKEQIVRVALEEYAGVIERDPEPVELSDEKLAQYTGTYETIAVFARMSAHAGGLLLRVTVKAATIAELGEAAKDLAEEQPPVPLKMLPGPGDRYVVTDGPAKGMRGYFLRGSDGDVEGVHVGGRLATLTSRAVEA